ncbi:MAG: hypothetical protein ACI9YO_001222 [Gammaproteobacteria bacterium]|jgi:hypothetical protein
MKTLILLVALLMTAPVHAEQNLFNVLVQDKSLVKDIRSEGDNVWIKLASANLTDEVTVRISNKDKEFYRTWFNGNVDLESKGFRGRDVWSDRVQTEASYIEYWLNGTLVLHLQRK